jgi:hypothetical protein
MPRRRSRWWQWWKKIKAAQLRDHLEETFPEGSDREKLRGLILCVRSRHRDDGNLRGAKREAIADRAQINLESVTEIVRGEFRRDQWPAIETVLKVVNATTAELEVAHEMYDRISWTGWLTSVTAPAAHWLETSATVPVGAETVAAHEPILKDPTATLALYIHEMDRELNAPPEHTPRIRVTWADDFATAVDDLKTAVKAKALPGEVQEERLPATNPLDFKTVEDFVSAIEGFRDLKGAKTYREMAKGCQALNAVLAELAKSGERIRPVESRSAAALNTIGKKGKLPNLQTVRAYIVGAGGDLVDLTVWELAWANLAGLLEADKRTRDRRKGG